MKSIKKTADCIRNSQNCKCYAYRRSCKRGLEAKAARESSHRLFLKGARSEHIANRTSNRSTRASKNDKIYFFFAVWGGQKSEFFDRLYSKSFFGILLPTKARNSFLKTCGAKTESEHKNHERGNLKLAFSMHIRIMIRREQFFCISLGECRAN